MSFDLGGMLSQLLSPEVQNAGADSGAQIASDSKAAEQADGTSLPGFSVGDFVNGILQHVIGGKGKGGADQMGAMGINSPSEAVSGIGKQSSNAAEQAMQTANRARASGGGGGSGGLNPADLISSITSLFGIK